MRMIKPLPKGRRRRPSWLGSSGRLTAALLTVRSSAAPQRPCSDEGSFQVDPHQPLVFQVRAACSGEKAREPPPTLEVASPLHMKLMQRQLASGACFL
jgi:hypothetical protein